MVPPWHSGCSAKAHMDAILSFPPLGEFWDDGFAVFGKNIGWAYCPADQATRRVVRDRNMASTGLTVHAVGRWTRHLIAPGLRLKAAVDGKLAANCGPYTHPAPIT